MRQKPVNSHKSAGIKKKAYQNGRLSSSKIVHKIREIRLNPSQSVV